MLNGTPSKASSQQLLLLGNDPHGQLPLRNVNRLGRRFSCGAVADIQIEGPLLLSEDPQHSLIHTV